MLCLNKCGTMTSSHLYTIFYLRKHRKGTPIELKQEPKIPEIHITGRGERKIFQKAIVWMSNSSSVTDVNNDKLKVLLKILPYIPDCGYWKDLLVLMGTPAEPAVIKLFGDQLIKDHISYHNTVPGLISMATKWAPNEGSSSDMRHNTYGKIAGYMGVTRKILRKEYLVPLRRYLPVTEQIVSNKQWSLVNYNMVPRLGLKLHKNTFLKYDADRFNNFLDISHVDYCFHLV